MEKVIIDFKEELSSGRYLSSECKIDISNLQKYNVIANNFNDNQIIATFEKAELVDNKLVLNNINYLPTKFRDKIIKSVDDGLLNFCVKGTIMGFIDKRIFDIKLVSVYICQSNKK